MAYAAPGAFNEPIQWHTRHERPAYRPFSAFAGTKPTPPPPFLFGVPAEELEQRRKDAEFAAQQHRLATTPGAPLRPAAPALAPAAPSLVVVAWRGAVARGSAVCRLVVDIGGRAGVRCRDVAARCDRAYWLMLCAYRRSAWPQILRLLQKLVLVLVVLAIGVYIAKLKLDERRNEERVMYYVLVPNYRSWSVSKPR
ncbi:hypothetical protein F4677DRAFT_403260 [Hypoxylon crocopeplum]|nr:hypothetical protein F4677DRAFT_403260 [Hypoxylon crocopeplum]